MPLAIGQTGMSVLVALVVLVAIALLIVSERDRWHLSRLVERFQDTARSTAQVAPPPSPLGPASQDVWSKADEFARLGFEWLATERGNAGELILLLRPRDGVFAEVVRYTSPETPEVLELTSVLSDAAGMMCSSTNERQESFWSGELRQVFPGATPDRLVLEHETTLDWLAGRGIRAYDVQRGSAVDLRDRMRRRSVRAAAATRRKEIVALAVRFARGASPFHGRLQDHADIDRRIRAYHREIARSEAG